MTLKKQIIRRMLLWAVQWARLLEGLIGVLTLGFWSPPLALGMAKKYARWVWRNT